MSTTATLDAADIVWFAALFGGFGGLVYVCTKLSIRGKTIYFSDEQAFFVPVCVLGIASVISGAASAIGILFIFHFLQLLKSDNTPDNKLFLISAFLIAGIAAQKLIPRYTKSLEDKLNALEKSTEDTKTYAEEVGVLTKAQASLREGAPISERRLAADYLSHQIARYPLGSGPIKVLADQMIG